MAFGKLRKERQCGGFNSHDFKGIIKNVLVKILELNSKDEADHESKYLFLEKKDKS